MIKRTWKKERRVYIYTCNTCGKTRQTYKRKKTRSMCGLCKRNWVNPNQGTLFPAPAGVDPDQKFKELGDKTFTEAAEAEHKAFNNYQKKDVEAT